MATLREYYESGDALGDAAGDEEERIAIVRQWSRGVQGDIIDVGCADGRLSAQLRGEGRRVIGVDLNPKYLKLAAQRLDDAVSFDITGAWPYRDQTIAAIHMGAVIEHIFDFRSMFSEAARVLLPAGHLWISVPNMACLRHRFDVLVGRMPTWYTNYEHIRPWTVEWLDLQLQPVNLERTRLRGAHIKTTTLHRFISRALPRLSSLFVAEYSKAATRA